MIRSFTLHTDKPKLEDGLSLLQAIRIDLKPSRIGTMVDNWARTQLIEHAKWKRNSCRDCHDAEQLGVVVDWRINSSSNEELHAECIGIHPRKF